MAKLGKDSAVAQLAQEAESRADVTDRTRQRALLALEEAAEQDEEFAAELREALDALPDDEVAGGSTVVRGTAFATKGGIADGPGHRLPRAVADTG